MLAILIHKYYQWPQNGCAQNNVRATQRLLDPNGRNSIQHFFKNIQGLTIRQLTMLMELCFFLYRAIRWTSIIQRLFLSAIKIGLMTGLLLAAKKVLHLQTGPNQHKVILRTLRYQTDRWISSVTWKIIMPAVEFVRVHYFSSQSPHQLE